MAFTTADLPPTFRADAADASLLRAVRDSGLRLDTVDCPHRRTDCPTCLLAAARALVGSAGSALIG